MRRPKFKPRLRRYQVTVRRKHQPDWSAVMWFCIPITDIKRFLADCFCCAPDAVGLEIAE
jgi:hypothetical protein